MLNPYEVLGVRPGADMDEIKRAYRRKARECHPDLHPEDPRANEKMQQVNEAYATLSDPGKARARQGATDARDGARASAWTSRPHGGWQYTYSSTDGGRSWQGWDASDGPAWQGWERGSDPAVEQEPRRATALARPFRGILRVMGGILLFRFFLTLLRFGLWGFFL